MTWLYVACGTFTSIGAYGLIGASNSTIYVLISTVGSMSAYIGKNLYFMLQKYKLCCVFDYNTLQNQNFQNFQSSKNNQY